MVTDDFEKKMENLQKPGAAAVQPPIDLKLAIVSASRSAAIGVWFVVVPCFFIACVVMKYLFHINLGLLDVFEETISALDRSPSSWWIQPVLLMGLPLVSIILNLLSITHFQWQPGSKALVITLKLRWMNLLILFLSLGIVMIFFLYLLTENFQARPGH